MEGELLSVNPPLNLGPNCSPGTEGLCRGECTRKHQRLLHGGWGGRARAARSPQSSSFVSLPQNSLK